MRPPTGEPTKLPAGMPDCEVKMVFPLNQQTEFEPMLMA